METADILSPEDAEALAALNRTDRDWPWVGSVPALVEDAARRHPDALAVRSPTGDWTYAELVDHAQGIAETLRQMRVGVGDRVVILMERSREMLGALIGVLGAGAAYVPVDPKYPEARVRYVIENAKAATVITHRGLERRFHLGVRILDVDAWSRPEPSAFHATDPNDTAYVIYTSGSTGKPKGVEIAHSSLVNFLRSMVEEPGLSDEDVVLAVTTIAFDIAVLELFLPLVVGARVVIADEREVVDARALTRRLEEEGITLLQATPATWKLLITSGWQGARNLRALCGGEALPRSLADDLSSRVAELWNMYGPTETI
jgi:non-ribosomal peptide synthetase component F